MRCRVSVHLVGTVALVAQSACALKLAPVTRTLEESFEHVEEQRDGPVHPVGLVVEGPRLHVHMERELWCLERKDRVARVRTTHRARAGAVALNATLGGALGLGSIPLLVNAARYGDSGSLLAGAGLAAGALAFAVGGIRTQVSKPRPTVETVRQPMPSAWESCSSSKEVYGTVPLALGPVSLDPAWSGNVEATAGVAVVPVEDIPTTMWGTQDWQVIIADSLGVLPVEGDTVEAGRRSVEAARAARRAATRATPARAPARPEPAGTAECVRLAEDGEFGGQLAAKVHGAFRLRLGAGLAAASGLENRSPPDAAQAVMAILADVDSAIPETMGAWELAACLGAAYQR